MLRVSVVVGVLVADGRIDWAGHGTPVLSVDRRVDWRGHAWRGHAWRSRWRSHRKACKHSVSIVNCRIGSGCC